MEKKKTPLVQKKAQTLTHKGSGRKSYKVALRRFIFIAVIVATVVGVATTAVGVGFLVNTPPIDRNVLQAVQTSYLLDKDDREVWGLHGEENRIAVPLSEIPWHVQEAFIAIEDERFYGHFGWDIRGFIRAAWVNLRARRIVQGGSTISMQLVENAGMLTERSRIRRKAQEIWLAIKLERQFSKEEVLEMYLNRIYFGRGAYGVEAAAQAYFNKSVGELEIHEAAFLAALVRAPEFYNAFAVAAEGAAEGLPEGAAEGETRMRLVLGSMRRLRFISEEQYRQASEAQFIFTAPPELDSPYPWFIDHVLHNELHKILDPLIDGDRAAVYEYIYTQGLRIYTTLDTGLQAHVQNVLNNSDLYPRTLMINIPKLTAAIAANNNRLPADFPAAYIDEVNGIPQPQSALVLACPKTGAIWALGGGRDYAKKRNEVLRFLSPRQSGSAIKPVITYAPAIEEGLLGAGSALDDAPFIGAGPQPWFPENFDGRYRGMVSVREALAHSHNIPAVRAFQQLGPQLGAQYAYKMGLSNFTPGEAELSWTLGAREVSALEMTQAFAVFANDGLKVELHTVRRIEDRHGQLIYQHQPNPVQLLKPQTTFIINDIQQDVVRYTTARGLQSPRPMAAKSGTTDDARDVYLSAYAPNVVATFWMGYDHKIMGSIPQGWNYTTGVLRQIFSELFKTLPVEQFKPAPSGVVRVQVCAKSGLLPSEQCREAGTVITDYFLANHVPRVTCNMHLRLEICEVSGQLAGEFCPEDQIEQRFFFNRPDYITTDGRWRRGAGRKPLDAEESAPTEKCPIHIEFSGEITSFSAEAGVNEIRLTWQHSGPQVTEFRLYRQAEDEIILSPLVSLEDDQFSYTDRAVEAGKTYRYSLYAVYAHWSSETVTARVTLAPPPLPVPENFTAERIIGGIHLSWRYEQPVESFEIRRTFNGGAPTIFTVWPFTNEFFDPLDPLAPGTYRYEIVAIRQGARSEPASAELTID